MRDLSLTLRRSSRIKNKTNKTNGTNKNTKQILPPKVAFKKEYQQAVKAVEIAIPNPPRRSERIAKLQGLNMQNFDIGNVGVMKNIKVSAQKKSAIDWSKYSSATSTKNFLLDDGFLDLLQYRSSSIIKADANYSKDIGQMIAAANNTTSFVPSLLTYGNLFESKIVELLKREAEPHNTIYIGGNPRSDTQYENTIKAIKKGIPLIFQANLRNLSNQTYGVSDLLIRSDWINRFFDVNPLSEQEETVPSNLMDPQTKKRAKYHYVVIDIKYKCLPLRADGIHLRNDAAMKAYKGQLLIYRDCLEKIQGYAPPYAFILGSKWKYTKNGQDFEGKTCMERLGRIDYSGLDFEYIEKVEKALQWLKDVRENEYDLSKYPLERDELYPNMCNKHDYPFHNVKKRFAENNNDITLLWNVGPKQRRIANEQDIYTWTDERCTPEALGMKGKRSKVLTNILEANRSDVRNIYPKYIDSNFGDWKNESKRKVELYVDFETNLSVFNEMLDLPLNSGLNVIFMIGAGYIHPSTKKWIYTSFVVDSICDKEEENICLKFLAFIETLKKKFRLKSLNCWHYSPAECVAWKRAQKRSKRIRDVKWTDLLKVFIEGRVGVKGALNFSLKTLVKTFHAHGYIETSYDESSIGDGADAAIGAFRADLECKKNGISFQEHELTKEIVKYNEIDTKVMMEILSYLRRNHCKR